MKAFKNKVEDKLPQKLQGKIEPCEHLTGDVVEAIHRLHGAYEQAVALQKSLANHGEKTKAMAVAQSNIKLVSVSGRNFTSDTQDALGLKRFPVF